MYASDSGFRAPQTPHRADIKVNQAFLLLFHMRSASARRTRPPHGPNAPHIAGGHPMGDPSASGTPPWPSRPTGSSRRPASGPTPLTLAGHVWSAGGSGSAAKPPPAVPAPRARWCPTSCSGRPGSWSRRTRRSRSYATSAKADETSMRCKLPSCEGR